MGLAPSRITRIIEWADAQTDRADLSWSLPGMHSFLLACYWKVFSWWNSNTCFKMGLAQYGTTLGQWYVVHSLERLLDGSMIDDEFVLNFYSYSCLQTPHVQGTGVCLPDRTSSRGRKQINKWVHTLAQFMHRDLSYGIACHYVHLCFFCWCFSSPCLGLRDHVALLVPPLVFSCPRSHCVFVIKLFFIVLGLFTAIHAISTYLKCWTVRNCRYSHLTYNKTLLHESHISKWTTDDRSKHIKRKIIKLERKKTVGVKVID
jgi:hypothetical protein